MFMMIDDDHDEVRNQNVSLVGWSPGTKTLFQRHV